MKERKGIMKYRKKPVVIEAIQFDGNNKVEIMNFMSAHEYSEEFLDDKIMIPTLEGNLTASPKDWIIKGVKGEFYPCKPDIFEATYEPV